MLNFKKAALIFTLCFSHLFLFAQTNPEPEDFMNSNGKIYVVMVVVIIIVLGILIYLINLDKKISKLEKNNRD